VKSLPSPLGSIALTPERALTIGDMRNLVVRRRSIILSFALSILALASLYCLIATKRYTATATIEIQKDSADALRLESMMQGEDAAADALDENITLQTQANILQSDTLALRVIEDLHLDTTKDFKSGGFFNPFTAVLSLFSPPAIPDPPHASLEQSPRRRAHVLSVFAKNLTVTPIVGTRLIQVSYIHSDRAMAADVVNDLVKNLVNFSYETRYKATAETSQWLTGQMADLRKQSEDLQAKVAALQKQAGVYTVGDAGPDGKTQAYSSDINRLELATAELSNAQTNRILTGALYQTIKTGNADLISGIPGSPMASGASPAITSSLTLIQGLRTQEAALQGQMAELSSKFSPDFPKLVDMRSNLAEIQKSIDQEVARMGTRAANDYKVAQAAEDESHKSYQELKERADDLNDKTIAYELTRQEAADSRTLYTNLLGRLKEAGLLEGLRSTNVTVVDPGRTPSKPSKPNLPLFLGGGLVAGLFLGFCGALLVDATDTRIIDLDEIELMIGDVPIGILPTFARSSIPRLAKSANRGIAEALEPAPKSLLALEQPNSPYVESLKAIRTSLFLSNGGSAPPQVLLITSSVEGEGKSTLASNFAVLLAQQGKRVLLVDADLRQPRLQTIFGAPMDGGLSAILSGHAKSTCYSTPVAGLPDLKLLSAGDPETDPTDLLSSAKMLDAIAAWRREYNFIILDAAPVLSVTDPVILSGFVDATLLLARYKYADRQLLARSHRLLQMHGGSAICVVLNGVERDAERRYSCYGYVGNGAIALRNGGDHANI
jgi:succinoglycan biosynthesis transport protein ExoP